MTITNVNAYGKGVQYAQSFGKKNDIEGTNNIPSKDYADKPVDLAQGSMSETQADSKTQSRKQFIENLTFKMNIEAQKEKISKLIDKYLTDNEIVDRDKIDMISDYKGKDPCLRLISPLYFYKDGKKFTGCAKMSDTKVNAYQAFVNGELKASFVKDDKQGIVGLTNEMNKSALYIKTTPEKMVVISTIQKDGYNEVLIAKMDKDGRSVDKIKVVEMSEESYEAQKIRKVLKEDFDNQITDIDVVF